MFALFGVAGCFGSIESRPSTSEADGGARSAGDLDAATGVEEPSCGDGGQSYACPEDAGPPRTANASGGMIVDGVSCTDVTALLELDVPPVGNAWSLTIHGTCGALGLVDGYINAPQSSYPRACHDTTFMRFSIGSEGDAGMLAYDASDTLGSCLVSSGPTPTNASADIVFTATIENSSGNTHSVTFSNAP